MTHTQRRGLSTFFKLLLMIIPFQCIFQNSIIGQYYFNVDWSAEAGYLIEEEFADMYIYEDSIYILGNTFDGASQKLLFSKYAPDGSLIYEKKVQSGTNLINLGYRIYERSGVFYLTGITAASSFSDYDIMVLKYLADGTEIYNISYNHSSDRDDYPVEINADENGNAFLCAGITSLQNDLNFGFIVYDSSGTNIVETIYDSGNLDDKPFLMGRDGDYFNIIGTSGYNDTILNVISILYEEDGTPLDSTEIVQLNTAGVQALGVKYGADNHFMFSCFRNGQDSSGLYTRRYDDNLGQVFADSFYIQEASIVRGQIVGGDSTMYVGFVSEKGAKNNLKVLEYDMAGDIDWSYGIEDTGQRMYITKDEDSIIIAYQTSENRLSIFKLNDEGKKIWHTEFDKSIGQVHKLVQEDESYILSSKEGSTEYELSNVENLKRPMVFEQDTSGKNLYVEDEFIIRFRPSKLDTGFIDDPNKTFGTIGELITDTTLIDTLSEKLNYGNSVANWKLMKIFPFFNTQTQTIQGRDGNYNKIPSIWSALILQVPPSPQRNTSSVIDSLNKISKNLIYYSQYNASVTPAYTPSDEFYAGEQHSLHYDPLSGFDENSSINMEAAWDLENHTGKTVSVAIFDDGINHNHEDFGKGEDLGGINGSIVESNMNFFNTMPASQISDSGLTELIDNGEMQHGTRVAGIIGALRNNPSTSGKGIAGIAGNDLAASNNNELDIYSYRFYSGMDADLAGYAGSLAHAIMAGIDIFNSSIEIDILKIGDEFLLSKEQLEIAFHAGIIQVASRGNANDDEHNLPATANENWMISVGASDDDGNFLYHSEDPGNTSWGSSYGLNMDIIAPGSSGLVYSIGAENDEYHSFSGTSASAPHATGIAALLSLNSPIMLYPEDVENILECSAFDFDSAQNPGYDDEKGWGIANAKDAMELINDGKKLIHANIGSTQSTTICEWEEDNDCSIALNGFSHGVNFIADLNNPNHSGYINGTIVKYESQLAYEIKENQGLIYNSDPGNGKDGMWVRNSASNMWGPPDYDSLTQTYTFVPERDVILEIDDIATSNSEDTIIHFKLTGYRVLLENTEYLTLDEPSDFPPVGTYLPEGKEYPQIKLSILAIIPEGVEDTSDDEVTIGNESVGTVDIKEGYTLKVYPNPTNSVINIETDQNFSTIRIMSSNGIIVKYLPFDYQIDISDFSSGIYFLTCIGDFGSKPLKISIIK